jgi:hypothetical protein
MIRTRLSRRFAIAAAVAGVAASFTAPLASADKLSNGLDVTCKAVTDLQLTCVIGGCPRVHGDYVVDAVHVMQNGHQDEYEFKCINGATATHNIATTVQNPITLGFQACRKKDLEGDWCGPWADYTYQPVAAAPNPQQQQQQAPVQCPPDSPVKTVPAGQTCPAAPPPVQCPPDSPVKTVPAGQTCPAAPPVTDAIGLSFGQPKITLIPPSASITATVTNSSALPGKCTYDATPGNTHRDFTVPAKGSTPLTFSGLATGTNYHATVSCTDSSGKQTQPIGSASQDVTF